MKTRAILQTSPFKNMDGEWRAWARPGKGPVEAHGVTYIVCAEQHADLKPGDTITVERHGSEWRAV